MYQNNYNNGNQGGYRNNGPQKMYCGGMKQEWKQGRNGSFESNRGWFSLKQAFEAAFGQQGWQQVESLLRSLRPVTPNVVRLGNNGDIYIKFDMNKRREPSRTGDTHSLSVNTYEVQQQSYNNQQQQGGYHQPQQQPAQQYQPYQYGAPPVQSHAPRAGASTPGHAQFQHQPQQPVDMQDNIPGLPPAGNHGGYNPAEQTPFD